MIPKIIHYCWFGKNPLPDDAIKCISSWRTYFPDYKIKQWDESNFNIDCCDYVREAYKSKKWAYVSDYARFWILYNFGGIYFDTDVEVINSFENIIEKGPFMGKECGGNVAPGLGLGITPGLRVVKEILNIYEHSHYIFCGKEDEKTVVNYMTDLLLENGYIGNNEIEYIKGIYIYPEEYFCPLNYMTGELSITSNTKSIHHYTASWHSARGRQWISLEQTLARKYGRAQVEKLFHSFIWILVRMLYSRGLKETLQRIVLKIKGLKIDEKSK